MIELTGKYTTAKIYAETIEEGVYSQIYDIINCRAFKDQTVCLMPDTHVGKSGPIGLVATIGDWVNPDHVGVDIGCTVSMIEMDKSIPVEKYAEFEHKVKKAIPTGFNIHPKVVIDEKEFYKFLTKGFNKYRNMWPEMLEDLPDHVTEKWVADQLKRLGMDMAVFYKSLGTLGGGNHYLEYGEGVEELIGIDYETAGLDGTSVTTMMEKSIPHYGFSIHCGSRNFGVKVCNYWENKSMSALSKSEIKELTNYFKANWQAQGKPMKEDFRKALNDFLEEKKSHHINGYLTGEYMRGYLCDMCFAQLYAAFNHQTIQKRIKDILHLYGIKEVKTITSTHNFIDLQDHVLRKSAIRAYSGEDMLVPFNMRDGVAICEGKSNLEWLNSCAHGAGRKMSRSKAKENISMDEFTKSMEGIYSTTVCRATLDESPMAYKDTNEIKDLIKETCDIKYMITPKINIKAADGGD